MAKLGFTTGPGGSNGGSNRGPGVTVLRQDAGVEPLLEGRAACISTMSYNEYWQVIDAGIKPAQLRVFRYEDEGVATLEDGLYALAPRLQDPAMAERLARFLRASVAGWRYAMNPAHGAEVVRIVQLAGAPNPLDASKERRMLREIVKLLPGSGHGLGYLAPAAYERTVDVLLSAKTNPVIRRRPEAAWTHAVWNKAFAR